jgi:hypothetical protein
MIGMNMAKRLIYDESLMLAIGPSMEFLIILLAKSIR